MHPRSHRNFGISPAYHVANISPDPPPRQRLRRAARAVGAAVTVTLLSVAFGTLIANWMAS
jgi:hypothetical protein